MDNSGNAGSSTEPPKASGATTAEPVSNRSGCGCSSSTKITVRVTPTTGGQFDLQVAKTESVENLKKFISKKLKVPKERICLLHRDRQLRDGTLQENQLMDGSRLTLLPSVETGLLAQRPEQSVMQALESLNDSQVNDFLSGKAPLNLTMRLGDHMMLIQLQLSTVTPSSSRRSATASSTAPATSSSSKPAHTSAATFLASSQQQRRLKAATTTSQTSSASVASQTTAPDASPTTSTDSTPTPNLSQLPLPLHTPAPDAHQPTSPVSSTAPEINFPVLTTTPDAFETASPVSTTSPVSSTSRTTYPISTLPTSGTTASTSPTSRISTPYSPTASRTPSATPNRTPSPAIRFTPPPKSFTSFYSPSAAPKTPIPETLCATPISSSHSPLETTTATTTTSVGAALPAPKAQTTTPAVFVFSGKSTPSKVAAPLGSSPLPPRAVNPGASPPCKCEPPAGAKPTLDTRALAEASRNLTQTLKQLSSEVLTSRADPAEDTARARRQGAIIESMHHHGKGVYSGTFSGTLNPALQDRFGRPKRDISTIIHILNDLLCATPQYRRHARQAHTFTVEASSGSPPKQTTTTTATVDKSPVASDESTEETNSLSLENQATRGKMEHLRLIMEERRARRRARREARVAPYTTQWSAKSESLSQAGTSHEPMDTDPSPSEQQLCELNPPEPVVA